MTKKERFYRTGQEERIIAIIKTEADRKSERVVNGLLMKKVFIGMKEKIFLLLAVVVLLIGCGKISQKVSAQNGFSEQIESRLLKSGFVGNTNIWSSLDEARRIIQLLLKYGDGTKWASVIWFMEDEKKSDYMITCVNEMYDVLREYLSEENMENLQVYMPALRGETAFYYTKIYINSLEKKEDSIRNGLYYMEKITMKDYYRLRGIYTDYHNWMNRVAFIDLDGDGKKELIIHMTKSAFERGYMVLHEENGKIYLIDFPIDRLECLQENGIYIGGDEFGRTSYCHLIFQGEIFTEEELAGWDGENAYINGQKVSEEELEEWKAVHINKEARWYDVKGGYLSSYYQLDMFARNYSNWMPDKGNDYSYCIYDFNQDGDLELLVTIRKAEGIENHFYQVVSSGIKEMKQDDNGGGEAFDICNESLAAFYDNDKGIIYYRSWNLNGNSDVENRNYFYIDNWKVFYAKMDFTEIEESEKVKRIVKPESIPCSGENQVMNYKKIMLYLLSSYRKGVY